ncbi:MAG: restriction endonuclease, partial [Clostridia bacterium]|nr:restriction endonuclease [Clostridia bacterium]
ELLGKGGAKTTINDVDNMNGSEFEKFIADLFCKMGYDAKATQVSGDFGVDIIAKKSLETIAIQAKCYSQPVGVHAIMEVVGGAKKYGADKCMVITNNVFTDAAVSLAKTNDVELWNRLKLIEYMERYL